MKVYKTKQGAVVELDEKFYALPDADWDELLNREQLLQYLNESASKLAPLAEFSLTNALAPIGEIEFSVKMRSTRG